MSAYAFELMIFARHPSMGRTLYFPVYLAADDYMDVGGKATHGAVAEANIKNGMKQLRRAHFLYAV